MSLTSVYAVITFRWVNALLTWWQHFTGGRDVEFNKGVYNLDCCPQLIQSNVRACLYRITILVYEGYRNITVFGHLFDILALRCNSINNSSTFDLILEQCYNSETRRHSIERAINKAQGRCSIRTEQYTFCPEEKRSQVALTVRTHSLAKRLWPTSGPMLSAENTPASGDIKRGRNNFIVVL